MNLLAWQQDTARPPVWRTNFTMHNHPFVGYGLTLSKNGTLSFVGFPILRLCLMIEMQATRHGRCAAVLKEFSMHDLLIALAFVGILILPAIVASNVSSHPDEEK
jgi:hypothetical protein